MELWKCNCDLSCVACIRAGRRTVKVTQLSQIEQVLKGLGLLRHIHHAAWESQKTKGRLNGFRNVVAISAHTIAAICSKQTILEPIFCVVLYFSVWLFFSPLLEKKVADSHWNTRRKIRADLRSAFHTLCVHFCSFDREQLSSGGFFICWFRNEIHTIRWGFFANPCKIRHKTNNIGLLSPLWLRRLSCRTRTKMKNNNGKMKKKNSTPIQLFRGSQWTRAREKCGIGYGGSAHIS